MVKQSPPACQRKSSASNGQFEFHKRGQFFIRALNKTISVAAMGVNNPDRSPLNV
jgi:hypothetical protein